MRWLPLTACRLPVLSSLSEHVHASLLRAGALTPSCPAMEENDTGGLRVPIA